jgi:hypothetical protein
VCVCEITCPKCGTKIDACLKCKAP